MNDTNIPSAKGILWLKLDNVSRQKLQQLYPPKYPNAFYDHVTLAYDVARDSVSEWIDTADQATAYAYAANGNVEAVRVRTEGLPDTYGVPHVTLSTAKGIQPYESVAMLQADHTENPIEPAVELTGVIEFVPLR
jgi:hypothetical protein